MTIALIDGDIVTHRTAWTTQEEPDEIAMSRADFMIRQILLDTNAESYRIFLSCPREANFRRQIDPEYKANRKEGPKHLNILREFLCLEWKAEVQVDQEADDALGIHAGDDTIICSIDKDLHMIPGEHYNFVRSERKRIEAFEGIRNFYSQLLIGDPTDNVRGVDGLGKIKTARILAGATSEQELFDIVQREYSDDNRLLRNGRLLWIRRQPEQLWEFPIGIQEQARAEDSSLIEEA